MLVIFDGGNALTSIPIHRMLDNLLADRHITPVIGVFIDNPTATSRNDELPCNERRQDLPSDFDEGRATPLGSDIDAASMCAMS